MSALLEYDPEEEETPVQLTLEETDDATEMGHSIYTTFEGAPVVVLDQIEYENLIHAARRVVQNWEKGDLAGAVTGLASLLDDEEGDVDDTGHLAV